MDINHDSDVLSAKEKHHAKSRVAIGNNTENQNAIVSVSWKFANSHSMTVHKLT